MTGQDPSFQFDDAEGVMKKSICAATVAIACGASAALAADISRPGYYAPAPAAVAPVPFSWIGPYAGVNLGYQWGSVTHNATDPSGVFGGGQLGYNWQSGNFVYGLETDLQVSAADDTVAPFQFSIPWWGTTRARGGFAWNAFMFYGTAGLAYGGLKAQSAGLSENHTQLGWTIGTGVEVGLNRAWSAKAEYLYVDLGDHSFSVTGTRNGFWSNMLRLGVNYQF
jgi:outer membrane immunogenic protein